ncbi:uncharacterized protein bada [Osmerus mordax]|uniref:uncharacterized protein bada n=1 Tax=Osmerus mordax TaxID=8014 RepID=UPI00350ED85E
MNIVQHISSVTLEVMDEVTGCEGCKVDQMIETENDNHSDPSHTNTCTFKVVPNMTRPNKLPGGRVRLYSESQVCSQIGRGDDTEFQEDSSHDSDGAPFRSRSQSAPAALWAAKKYGRQLRRMSDEFDTWLDRGEGKRGVCRGAAQLTARGWFSFLWTPKEVEGRE